MTNSKIIFYDGTEFSIIDYPVDIEPSIFEKKRTTSQIYRETLRVTVNSDYAIVAEKFVNNAEYFIRQYDIDENNNILETYTDFDKSNFCVAGDIVDHRDGRITVYMGKKTEHELMEETLNILLGGEVQ